MLVHATRSCGYSHARRNRASVGDEPKIGAWIRRADRGGRQIGIERQIEPGWPVLQSGQQQHLHGVEADGAKMKRLCDGLLHLMLMKILHQLQHLNELAAAGIAHPRFHQSPKAMNAFGEPPVVERRGLVERLALVFQRRQIMQGVVDKIGRLVAADVGGDRSILSSTCSIRRWIEALVKFLARAFTALNLLPSMAATAFAYLPEEDAYRCPAGERLPYRYRNEEDGKMLRRYWTTACQNCSLKSQCTTGPERRITRWEHEH